MLDGVGAAGYTDPTPIQLRAIPLILAGRDVIGSAQTGTGKTAAFALPMIDRLLARGRRSKTRGPIGLILVPTRELAVQVHQAFTVYGAPLRVRVTAIYGGASMSTQLRALRFGTDVVVATPGRLIDHLDRRTIDLSGVEILTLDEADRMLDMGFLPPLRRVQTALPSARQTLLFSATLPETVMRLAGEFTRDAVRIDVSQGETVAPTITHRIHPVAQDRKRALLLHLLMQAPADQALVFCKTKRGADRVGEHLEGAGVNTAVIHGDKTQGARTRALTQFKAGHANVLVATDIAARGLDVAQLPLVVNYDLPLVAEDYVHRVGRTGRAGAPGRALSLVTSADRGLLRDIQKLLSAPLEQVAISGFDVTTAATPSSLERQPSRTLHERPARSARRIRPPQPRRPFRARSVAR